MDRFIIVVLILATTSLSQAAYSDYTGCEDYYCQGTCLIDLAYYSSMSCYRQQDTNKWCSSESDTCWRVCPYGYQTDQYGCYSCSCRTEPAVSCPKALACENTCVFGRSFDSNGCPSCDCLSNGCEDMTCPIRKLCAVSVEKTCSDCPRCTDEDSLGNIRMSMKYNHPAKDNLNLNMFTYQARKSLKYLFRTDPYNNLIIEKTQFESNTTISVILTIYGGYNYNSNASDTYKKFVLVMAEGINTTISYNGLSFTPNPYSISVQHVVDPYWTLRTTQTTTESWWRRPYTSAWYPVYDWNYYRYDNGPNVVAIVLPVVFGVLLIVIVGVVIVVIRRRRNKQSTELPYKQMPKPPISKGGEGSRAKQLLIDTPDALNY